MRSQQGLFSPALYGLVDHRPRTGLPHGGDRDSGRPSTFQQLGNTLFFIFIFGKICPCSPDTWQSVMPRTIVGI